MKIKSLYRLFFAVAASFILLQANQVLAQPANDNCANAISLTVNADCISGNTNGATLEGGEDVNCGGSATQSVWYSFVATNAAMDVVVIRKSGKCNFGSAVFNGVCVPATANRIACEDIADGPTSQNLSIDTLTVGNTYYVQVFYNGGAPCNDYISFCVSVLDNLISEDDCANAYNVQQGTKYHISNIGATADKDLCSGSTENNIWFKWVVPSDWTIGDTAFVHLFNQECDNGAGMQMSVFKKNSCGLIPNPAGTGDCDFYSNQQTTDDIYYTWVPDVIGEVYYFDLDGYGGTSCIFDYMVSPFQCLTLATNSITNASCGVSDGEIHAKASNSTAPYTFTWASGGTQTNYGTDSSEYTGLAQGTYTLTITDADGCQVSETYTVAGPADASWNHAGDLCADSSMTFNGTGSAGATYDWRFKSTTTATSTDSNGTFTRVATPGTYLDTLIITKNGCKDTVAKSVTLAACNICQLTVSAGADLAICDTSTTDTLNGSYQNADGGSTTYYIDDDFESYANDAAFENEWTVTEESVNVTDLSTEQASSGTQSIKMYDNETSGGGDNNTTMGKYFTGQSQSFTVEFNIYLSDGDNFRMYLFEKGTGRIGPGLEWDAGDLGTGYICTPAICWTNQTTYSYNTWYAVKMTVDIDADNYDLYFDGTKVASDVGFIQTTGELDSVSFLTLTNVTCNPGVYLDDVKVYVTDGGGSPRWSAVAPTDTAWLSSTTAIKPAFTPPNVDSAVTYQYVLSVTDGCTTKRDTVMVTVSNCCELSVSAGSDSTFNMDTQTNMVFAGSYTGGDMSSCPQTSDAGILIDTDTAKFCSGKFNWTGDGTSDYMYLGNGATGRVIVEIDTFNGTYCSPANYDNVAFRASDGGAISLSDGGTLIFATSDNSDASPLYADTADVDYMSDGYIRLNINDAGCGDGNIHITGTWRTINDDGSCACSAGTPTVAWSPSTYLSATDVLGPTFTPTAPGNYVYTLSVTDSQCTRTDDILITVEGSKIFRSKQTGNWNVLTTWEESFDNGGIWIDATTIPAYTDGTITIRTHTVTITADLIVDQVTIDVGGTLIYNAGTLTINNGTGTDLVMNGTFIDEGPNSVVWQYE